MTTEAAGDDIENWRALVFRLAEQAQIYADELSEEHDSRGQQLEDAAELRRLGRWLDDLTLVTMRNTANGEGQTRP